MDNTFLEHHGVKGMKWGVRRYQNKDGTLTSAGRRKSAESLTPQQKTERNKKIARVGAEGMINTVLYAKENYKGTGTPDAFMTPHMLNQMLLARDLNGRRIYASRQELATALNVGTIHTVEQFEGKTRTTSDNKKKKLVAIIANLADYSLGATKGGEITHFTQFDIDFNQEKSLLETRCSGALTRVYAAIAVEEDVTTASSDTSSRDTVDSQG